MATDEQLAEAARNAAAEQPAGVSNVVLDGVTTTFDAEQRRKDIEFFERRAARAAKTRPVCFSVKLG